MVKDQEYLNSIASQTIEYSKKLGATDVNVEVVHSISETVNLRNKQLDESNRSDSFAIGITTYINKKKSTLSSSNLSKNLYKPGRLGTFLMGKTILFFDWALRT